MQLTVGASLLAMIVNENACLLTKRSALESIASQLAPTNSRQGGEVSGLRFRLTEVGKQTSIVRAKLTASH